MLVAVTRAVSESLGRCELTHLERVAVDVGRARAQHAAYEGVLESLGVKVVRAAAAPELPDAVFVEDTAVVVEEAAVMARPGAVSRRAEVAGVAEVLGRYRRLKWMEEPGTLDGGDVLRVGRTLYVGRSGRTNEAGMGQLAEHLPGYRVVAVEVRGCLHLKSAVTAVGEDVVVVNPAWVDGRIFAGMERVEVDVREAYGGNALRVGEMVVYPAHFPRTRERLERRGVRVVTVECDELAKAEGAVTCCSILLEVAG